MAKVLILEPDTVLARTYREGLEFHGHEVDVSQDSQIAVDIVDKSTPDIIIVELQLALHNGIEFLYELRSYKEWQRIPVIIVSNVSYVEQEILSSLWKSFRISAYHYKPLTKISDIVHSIEDVLIPTK